ncbi:MAG: methylmalonyl-CoA mutase family protein [bacterium]|nr:methylmalonyl-CoA mutase family protein [bacterium]
MADEAGTMNSNSSEPHDRADGAQERFLEQRKIWESEVTKAGCSLRQPDGRPGLLGLPDGTVSSAYMDQLGFPGHPPFTRGVYPTMYQGRTWTMRQYAGYATATEANERFRTLLARGQTGISVAFDLPTQLGLDSDHPLARGEVGRVGVAIDTLADMESLFEGIQLDAVSTSMTINAPSGLLLALYVGAAQRQGISPESLSGTVQNDILKEYVSRGTYIFPAKPSMQLTTDLMAYTLQEIPRWNPISISGYHMREAGSTAAQELGYTFSHALAYAHAARAGGLDMHQLLPRFSFFFAVHNNFLEEVAKFRAGRRLWSRLVGDELDISDPACHRMRFHAQTAGSTLTAQQPLNNTVRTTLQALAAVLGGVQSLHVNAFDEALGLPSEAGVEIALKVQQILSLESGITKFVDPLGGSHTLEKLTDSLEEEALAHIREIEGAGGAVAAASGGFTAGRIADSAYRQQMQIESGHTAVVGVNAFVAEQEVAVESFCHPPGAEETQLENLVKHRANRSKDRVRDALDRVHSAPVGKGEMTQAFVEAGLQGATIGEITDVLKSRWGTYREGGVS